MAGTQHNEGPGGADIGPCRAVRVGLFVSGWVSVGLGVAGIFLPLMPTTVFLLIALWCFSKCSLRFHRWLWSHPRLGPPLRQWHAHRVIPRRAKVLALATMGASLAALVLVADGWTVPLVAGLAMAAVAGFIVTRASAVPDGDSAGA